MVNPVAKSHWTRDLKRENEALRLALREALDGAHNAVTSRLQKECDYPSEVVYGLGYVTCAKEILTRLDETHSRVSDILCEEGISLS